LLDGGLLEAELLKGAAKARAHAAPMLAKVRKAVGLAAFS
jgi:tryptophanyl-tRNA synthetase